VPKSHPPPRRRHARIRLMALFSGQQKTRRSGFFLTVPNPSGCLPGGGRSSVILSASCASEWVQINHIDAGPKEPMTAFLVSLLLYRSQHSVLRRQASLTLAATRAFRARSQEDGASKTNNYRQAAFLE
jgi:hypothetical protein